VRGAVFEIEGRADVERAHEIYTANPAYFRSVRIPLLKGRSFTDADTAESEPVAILSECVARRYWDGADPIGRPCGSESAAGGGQHVDHWFMRGRRCTTFRWRRMCSAALSPFQAASVPAPVLIIREGGRPDVAGGKPCAANCAAS